MSLAAAPAGVTTTVSYLEMMAPPARPPCPPPRAGIEVRRAVRPSLSFYRYLYDTVGAPWVWTERRGIDDATLAAIIQDPRVDVNVLWLAGVPAGYVELDRRSAPEIELAYFGLIPEYLGQGLGPYLLDWAIAHAWRWAPQRLWVHTCDLDHPAALPLYQRAGFRLYDQQLDEAILLPGMALPAHKRG
jgi:GNAT superfamily N-acetyltransferase